MLFFNILYATNTFAFVLAELLYKVGTLPKPFLTISDTKANDADIALTSELVADDAEMYCGVFVTLTLPYPFNVIVGNEPVPFSIILIILSKLPVTAFAKEDEIAIEEEY
jgi:hypothetical protein